MFLEKLEIQGFKSFAHKNSLVFPGLVGDGRRGLTAIVGPNGSGKSNIADAVRWALGEQSLKTLRGKKGDDIIFSGSDKKAQLGMAEVSLHLNNEDRRLRTKAEDDTNDGLSADGQKINLLLEQSQIILTRRLFRDGDSEYLINNRRVRLTDIQMFLAKASFGQKTYSVIGQGMVEGFLNTSLAERKDFFDEATGVKQYQIKRDIALNKLENSYENLGQGEMLLNEIEPRLKSLTRQVHRLEKRSDLEKELIDFQLKYYRSLWHELNDQFNDFNNKLLVTDKNLQKKSEALHKMNADFESMSKNEEGLSDYNNWKAEYNQLKHNKDDLQIKLHKLEATMEVNLEAGGHFDLSFLISRQRDLKRNLEKIETELIELASNLKIKQSGLDDLQKIKQATASQLDKINQEILGSGQNDKDADLQAISRQLSKSLKKLSAAEDENDIVKIKITLKEIRQELAELLKLSALNTSSQALSNRSEKLGTLMLEQEQNIENVNKVSLEIGRLQEKDKFLKMQKDEITKELADLAAKTDLAEGAKNNQDYSQDKKIISTDISKIDQKLEVLKAQLNKWEEQKAVEHAGLLLIQKNISQTQREADDLSRELNDLKISATRFETRLEDLEIEIRSNLGSTKEIKSKRNEEFFNTEELADKISQIKKQLDSIGGIDPEVSKEYEGTKERYDFLSAQTDDLHQTIKSLEKVICELDVTIKERFDNEFQFIADKFSDYFKILFNGGSAKIIKVMSSELPSAEAEEGETKTEEAKNLEANNLKRIKFLRKTNATGLAGIEIEASPPGKKIKTVAMLSGGERALTAIALICAIISANPSPFVVLDEVDAALDEANSERLAQILDDLSNKTQFIVITHNRASMKKASVLYGITMQADGISQLLSVKLDEVKLA